MRGSLENFHAFATHHIKKALKSITDPSNILVKLYLQGTSKNSNSSIRTDCAAKIRLHRRSDHAWYISSVNDTHNHRLTEAYSENKQWKSHGYIDPSTKDLIKKLRENNISVGGICNILGVSDGGSRARMRKESVRSICAKLAQENMRDDIGKTLRLLDKMKETDPGLEVRFQIDSGGRLKTMLWCTGKNRLDYATFGDAITFDTTYRTNLYSLPFGLFMGVNNHFQSIVLGGLLLTSEKTSDFEWAFTNFVEIMGGKAPVTMLTGKNKNAHTLAANQIPIFIYACLCLQI